MTEKELQNLFRFIETWDKTNIQLAMNIMKGVESDVYDLCQERYAPILSVLRKKRLDALAGLPEKILKLKSADKLKALVAWKEDFPEFPTVNNQFFLPFRESKPIAKIPDAVQYLKNVIWFDASSNDIVEVSPELFKLEKLRYLHISDNRIEKLPDNLEHLRNIKSLDFSRNNLKELPDSIYELPTLYTLRIDGNPRINHLSEKIAQLKNLNTLFLDKMSIENNLSVLSKLKELQFLHIKSTTKVEKKGILVKVRKMLPNCEIY